MVAAFWQAMHEAADGLGVHYRTVQDWVRWYRKGGVDEVISGRHGGSGGAVARLNEEQKAELLQIARAGKLRTMHDGVVWAQAQGVPYTYWGMRHVFDRLGLSKKVSRPKHPKRSTEAQEAWKKGG